MAKIPDEYQRIVEDKIDRILERHFSTVTPLASWFFNRAFGASQVSNVNVEIHKHKDQRKISNDPLAFGETDVAVTAKRHSADHQEFRACLLIENKVEANQMPQQGLRYRSRALHGMRIKEWDEFCCILLAPQSYLEARYSASDVRKDGWDLAISYEEVAEVIGPDCSDGRAFIEATKAANSWNKPIPQAVQFWKEYEEFGTAQFPNIPVIVKTEKGSRAGGVWPSFYDDELRRNGGKPDRKRIQIAHIDTGDHVSLFVKRVSYGDFLNVANGIVEDGMVIGPRGGSWQSLRIAVPRVNPLKPFGEQRQQVESIFYAAKKMFEFYIQHERIFLGIPIVTIIGDA